MAENSPKIKQIKHGRWTKTVILSLLLAVVASSAAYYAISSYVMSEAEENIQNILLSQRAVHQYIQQVMHPTFFRDRDKGEVPQNYYTPEIFSSSFIVRVMHDFLNKERVKHGLPEVYYKLASDNPRNPVNKADEFEMSLIRMFNEHRDMKQFRKIVSIEGKDYLYYAIPFLETSKACIRCHGKRSDAPPGLQRIYSGSGGFNEQIGHIRAIESVRTPILKEKYSLAITGSSIVAFAVVGLGMFLFNRKLKYEVNERTVNLEHEIEERVNIEHKLVLSRKQYLSLVEGTPDLITRVDNDGRFVFVNHAALNIFGLSPEECIGRLAFDFIHPEDRELTVKAFEDWLNSSSESFTFENRQVGIFGQEHYMSWSIRSEKDENGIVQGFAGTARDITDRKLAEEKITASERRFRSLFEEMTEGVALHSVIRDNAGTIINYRIEMVNSAYGYILRIPLDQVVGKIATEAYTCETAPYLKEYSEVALSKKPYHFSSYFPPMDKHFDISVIPWESDGFATIFLDVTQRVKAEELQRQQAEQLQHMQKLESLGVLAGGIAHDFNNILAIIMGNSSLARMDLENADNYLLQIENASDRAAGLCRQMLAYAGKAQFSQTKVNMWTLVDEMVNMLKATIPKNTVINPNLDADIPFVNGDASQLRQIVMNLIINASEAIGEAQGEIKVSLAKVEKFAGEDKDYIGREIPAGVYVRLEVTDNGCGMDEETKWRIFEPFYTTKFTGRGLGMSAVLGIIATHKGSLQLFTHPGQGTTFKILLPSELSGVEPHIEAASSDMWQGSGTILLAEDEDQIRQLAKVMFNKLGFTVIEASNGKEALELYLKNAKDITLVVTDMGMPVMDGYALIGELKQRDPYLPIIISSGFGDADINSRITKKDIAGSINKPYNFSQLQVLLKGVLSKQSA